MWASVLFLYKHQSVSLRKHWNGFAVVHLLSLSLTSVSERPLQDDRGERDKVCWRKRVLLSLSTHTSCSSPSHFSHVWQVKPPRWLTFVLASFESVTCIWGCIVYIHSHTYTACVCVFSSRFFPGWCVKWVVPDWNENQWGAHDPVSSERWASTPLLLP